MTERQWAAAVKRARNDWNEALRVTAERGGDMTPFELPPMVSDHRREIRVLWSVQAEDELRLCAIDVRDPDGKRQRWWGRAVEWGVRQRITFGETFHTSLLAAGATTVGMLGGAGIDSLFGGPATVVVAAAAGGVVLGGGAVRAGRSERRRWRTMSLMDVGAQEAELALGLLDLLRVAGELGEQSDPDAEVVIARAAVVGLLWVAARPDRPPSVDAELRERADALSDALGAAAAQEARRRASVASAIGDALEDGTAGGELARDEPDRGEWVQNTRARDEAERAVEFAREAAEDLSRVSDE